MSVAYTRSANELICSLLLAEEPLEQGEDALAQSRVGRDGKHDARRQRPRLERAAVGAQPLEDGLRVVRYRGLVECRRTGSLLYKE